MKNAYHVSRLGSFGSTLKTDINGYVPTVDCGPWELTYDHGTEQTHDEDGELTEYGQWWEDEAWPEIVEAAVAATEEAEQAIAEWQTT